VQIAVSSTGRIAVAWIGSDLNDTAIRVALSDDGGATWSAAQSVGRTVGDPILGALDDGSFLVGGLRADCTGNLQCDNGEIFLARIAAGGTAITALPSIFEVGNLFIDHPWMSVNGSAVSIIGAAFSADDTQSAVTVWRSTDHGGTWERSEVAPLSAANTLGVPRFCSGAGTRLWTQYLDGSSATSATMRFTDSADLGWTATSSTVASFAGDPTLVTAEACARSGDTVYSLVGTIAKSQPTSGGQDDQLPAYDVLVVLASDDLGQTWKVAAKVADGAIYLLPELVVEPDGTLDLFAYAGPTLGLSGARAELVQIHGGTADPPITLRDGLTLEDARGSSKWLGDYNGLAIAAGKPVFAFGDNTTIETKIRFARLR
jgi:hypothetical protein